MGIIGKIKQKVEHFYRYQIVCEQYPMLTSTSRKRLQAEGAIGLVYMLHHITTKNPKGIPTNEDLIVSPSFLNKIIIKYKKQGFNFISLDKLGDIISSNEIPEQPFIAFTIDDGYLDNFTEALPIFERHKIPFAVFVATDFIDKKSILWWDILEELVVNNDSITVGNREYQCHTFQEKWDTFRIIREVILELDQKNIITSLKKLFSNYDIDWFQPIRNKGMSWEHIIELSKHPLCTIGGHTVTHPALNKLNKNDFMNEVNEGIKKIEKMTNRKVYHFAYPYGSPNEIGEREWNLISSFNFRTIFCAYGGCVTMSNKSQKQHLPRVFLHDYS